MRLPVLAAALLALSTPLPAPAADAPPAARAQLERLKALAGTWKGKGHGMDVEVTWRVTGNGSAVVETMGPGTPYEMITVYHLDGDQLLLTHYCGAGNQPTLKAVGGDAGSIAFDFVRATNLKPGDEHMHALRITFVGPDALRSEWTSWKDGKPGEPAPFELTRSR